ncbi:hypothetical protein DICVIV_10041 [Dictyocaulus viviparus]|uniref:Uncharacterized protein n=1 Tax=Dictyocaulus viviparus TaxID=29172 RepID=A0A0D8XH55_DICVI|nr:hypothetical protein DICVIV_10041 [Dictyocaulus viviparus]
MLRLTRELKHQSISRRGDSSEEDDLSIGRRRSARLNPKLEQEFIRDSGTESDEDELEEIARSEYSITDEFIRDSGTESDEDELEEIARSEYSINDVRIESFMENSMETSLTESPPILSSSPPTASDIDTESWDSFGHESGIVTGDGDSTSDGDECPTPKPRRRMHDGAFSKMKFPKVKCEFPLLNVCGTIDKRRQCNTAKKDSGPIASRLRSNNDSSREIIVAARRAPVRLLINRPYRRTKGSAVSSESTPTTSFCESYCPVPKKSRSNSWRPCLDLEKMIRNRISSESARATTKSDCCIQDH